MGYTSKNGSLLAKWDTTEKQVSLGKMGHTWKNWSHLEKWVLLGKMGHT